MSEDKVLTNEIVRHFEGEGCYPDDALSEFTEIDDDAAEMLSDCYGHILNLDGLTHLSDAAAESLSRYQGALFLDGLTEISDRAAESLSKCKELYINLDNLPASAAQILRDAG